jgi:DNA-binding NtrC family response regulator
LFQNTFHKYNLTTETNSIKALNIIEKEKFDIYIINYQMPKINGIELFEDIKEMNKHSPYVGVICIPVGTNYILKEELISGLFHYFLEKPFEKSNLKEIVEKSLVLLKKIKDRINNE